MGTSRSGWWLLGGEARDAVTAGARAALSCGCSGGANDRDSTFVFHKQSNSGRAEAITLGIRLYRVGGASSTQFSSTGGCIPLGLSAAAGVGPRGVGA